MCPTTTKVHAFPRLSRAEFDLACTNLQHRFHQHKKAQEAWTSVDTIEKYYTRYLRITKCLHNELSTTPAIESADAEVEEDDDEVPNIFLRYLEGN
jgi:hypothetical protein